MKKILIIEDDPIVAHIYKSRLEKEGYEVDVAPDGQSGFYRIHEFHPDAVLLDLMLPKMNGVEILKKIRAQPQFSKTPIIVFTNAYVPNMIHESFQAGATQVFNKATLTPRQIIDAIRSAISFAAGPSAESAKQGEEHRGKSDRTVSSRQSPSDTGADSLQDEGESPFHNGESATAAVVTDTDHAEAIGFQNDDGVAAVSSARSASQGGDPAKDSEFQAELFQTFMETAPETLTVLRRTMQDFSKTQDEANRMSHLLELYRRTHALTGSAGIAGLHNISQIAAALEVLLKELYEKPKNINASTLRTVAHSIDFIAELVSKGADSDLIDANGINILVVDDEILSRRAVTYALEKAGLKSVSVEEAQTALNLATEDAFDLIFLDVQMPGMDGFELCTKIRTLPTNKNTPIIFVTSLTDFKSRARSSLSGGSDLIAKPFMFIELSVKALTYVLRGRLARRNVSAAA